MSEHAAHDKLVLWGWDPGVGREPVSVPHADRGFVAMRDDENTPFNKALRAQGAGSFALCATIQGHRGCLEGTVTEN